MFRKINIILLVVLLIGFISVNTTIASQSDRWRPEEDIEFVCHASPGGGSDMMARTIANMMESEGIITDVAIFVNNLVGQGGARSYNFTYNQAGNPYVWQTIASSFFAAPIRGDYRYTYEDYTILAVIGTDPQALAVAKNSEFNSVQDLIEAAKERNITAAAGNLGSSSTIANYLLEKAAGIELVYVPFGGGAEGLMAAMGGQVDLSWNDVGELLGPLDNDLVKVLAVTSEERLELWPDVPTFKELGIDFSFEMPRGVVAPPNIPQEAREFYIDAFKRLNESKNYRENYIEANNINPNFKTGQEAFDFFEKMSILHVDVLTEMGLVE